ncbi:MAG: serine hydrolase [Synechococcales cyanobacterium RU_4_20]|nr:serine hydrolase [Synechococcales cyanobacterium RU_4_20]
MTQYRFKVWQELTMAQALSLLCGLLLMGPTACQGSSVVSQSSPVHNNTPALASQVSEDTQTLRNILKQGDRLTQMEAWNGKALFIKVDDTQKPPQFQSISYRAQYQDTNNNQKQDSGDEGFFNPASTVKVAIAALTLERLNKLKISRAAEYRVVGTQRWFSIEDDLRTMLVASDNDATNRLILLLGFQHLNETMRSRGLQQYAVTRLMLNQGTLIDSPAIEIRIPGSPLPQQAVTGTLIRLPKQTVTDQWDCYEVGKKSGNCASAHDLAGILMRVVYPQAFASGQGFDLRPADRQWMQQVMSKTPQESGLNLENTFCRFLDPLGKDLAHQSGRLLSKCGIGLFSHTFVDTSFLETDPGQKYFIIFAVTPPRRVSKSESIRWLNETSRFILTKLN